MHTFTIAAGASWNVASNPADGTCTNLHYNGSGWDNVTLGTGSTSAYTSFNAEYSSGGRGSNGNTPYTAHTGSGGSGNEDINRTDGHAQTLTNMATPWEGGNGGLGGGFHSSTCNRGTSGGAVAVQAYFRIMNTLITHLINLNLTIMEAVLIFRREQVTLLVKRFTPEKAIPVVMVMVMKLLVVQVVVVLLVITFRKIGVGVE